MHALLADMWGSGWHVCCGLAMQRPKTLVGSSFPHATEQSEGMSLVRQHWRPRRGFTCRTLATLLALPATGGAAAGSAAADPPLVTAGRPPLWGSTARTLGHAHTSAVLAVMPISAALEVLPRSAALEVLPMREKEAEPAVERVPSNTAAAPMPAPVHSATTP